MYRTGLRAGTRRVAAGAVAGAQLGGGAVSARSLAPRGIGLEKVGRAAIATPRVRNVAITKVLSVITEGQVSAGDKDVAYTTVQSLSIKRNAPSELDIYMGCEVAPTSLGGTSWLQIWAQVVRNDGSSDTVLNTFTFRVPTTETGTNFKSGFMVFPWVDGDDLNGTYIYKLNVGFDISSGSASPVGVRVRYIRLIERQK